MNQITKLSVPLIVLGFVLSVGTQTAWSEEAAAGAGPAKTLQAQTIQERIAKWRQLKEQNPEEFKRLIQERKDQLKTRLRELKEKDPQKFEEVKKRIYQHRVKYLRKLRQENPEAYREIVERRWQKLQELQAKNPERFQEFMQRHPRIAERWEERQQLRGTQQGLREDKLGARKGFWQGIRGGGPHGRRASK